jgi:hypothetical protein
MELNVKHLKNAREGMLEIIRSDDETAYFKLNEKGNYVKYAVNYEPFYKRYTYYPDGMFLFTFTEDLFAIFDILPDIYDDGIDPDIKKLVQQIYKKL